MKQNIVDKKIMWGDLDSLGIVFYPRFYEWIDTCAHLFLESINLNMRNLWLERKILFGLAETSCRYFKPGRYHQKIHIITNIDVLEEKTIVLKHSIQAKTNKMLMVEGLEKRICLDVSNPLDFKAIYIPKDIFSVLKMAVQG